MNLLTIAFKSIRQRWLASSLTGLSVALGVSLMVAVLILNGVVADMFRETGSGYDLVVGPKGSDTQLILSAIYRIERPIENLPWRFYQEIQEHPLVEKAIPVNLGDTSEVGNFPIVGTTPEYFLTEYIPDREFRVRGEGLNEKWDAVIGAQVARVNNWDVGTEFRLIHSGQAEQLHEEKFTVRGVLEATGTPNDRTVFVHIDGFFLLDEHAKPVDEAIQREADFYGETAEEVIARYREEIERIREHEQEDTDGDDHHHRRHEHGPISDLQKEVTSILLVMKESRNPRLAGLGRPGHAAALATELRKGYRAQAANPVQVMSRLMTNLVGNVRLAFLYLTGLIIAVSGIGIFVSIYNSMSERKREIAIMRALGARRQTVFSIVLLESLLLCVLGGLAGLLLGHGLVFVAAPIIEARSGLLIDPLAFTVEEFIVIPILIVMATVIGLLPGVSAYRTDVAEALHG